MTLPHDFNGFKHLIPALLNAVGIRAVASVRKRGGGDIGETEVYNDCTTYIFRKIGVKSTVFELQKSFKHKSSSLNNFQKNEPDCLFVCLFVKRLAIPHLAVQGSFLVCAARAYTKGKNRSTS